MSRIGSPDEPGEPLVVRGTVFTPVGEVAPNVVVHSYHRDAEGFELGRNDRELTMWRLQGWAITDECGEFVFQTIRPAADHLGREAAHIHFTLVSEEYGNQWAPKVFLADDSLLSERDIARSQALGQFALLATPEKRGLPVVRRRNRDASRHTTRVRAHTVRRRFGNRFGVRTSTATGEPVAASDNASKLALPCAGHSRGGAESLCKGGFEPQNSRSFRQDGCGSQWWEMQELNLRPYDYESYALPI